MRPLILSALACATLSAASLVSPQGTAEASTGVARCEMPDGSVAYTNVSCASMGGRHVAMAADVQNRIRREHLREAELTGYLPPEGLLATPHAFSSRPKGLGCATTPQQLAADLRASMAEGDVNRIAESFDWVGMSHGQAMQMMTRLERLGGLSLIDAEFFGASTQLASAGTLQVVLQEAGTQKVADFDIRRHEGCYFLQHQWSV
jgi:hypothetical protein